MKYSLNLTQFPYEELKVDDESKQPYYTTSLVY